MNPVVEHVSTSPKSTLMKVINDTTPTSEIAEIKIGDHISNGLGTFGEVNKIDFEDHDHSWKFTFSLAGGGFIEATKSRNTC